MKEAGIPAKERDRIASDVVTLSSFGAAAITFVPVPMSDFVLVTPVQASMVASVGRIYGRELSVDESKHLLLELASVCGVSWVAQKGLSALTKVLLPGLGGVVAAPFAFAVTYGMGRVAMRYFRDRERNRERLREAYEAAFSEGKRVFSARKLREYMKNRKK